MIKNYKKLFEELIEQINHEVEHRYTICRKERDDLFSEAYFLKDVLGDQVAYNFLVAGYKCLANDQFFNYFRLLIDFHAKAAFASNGD